MVIRPEINALYEYKPGMNPVEEMRRLGITEAVRINLNEGPWPPFPDAIEAMQKALTGLNRYPDQSYRRIKQAISNVYGIDPLQICVGNGSGSLIRLVAEVALRPAEEVFVAWPPYPAYLLVIGINGAVLRKIPVKDGAMDLRATIDQMSDRSRIVFIANPHNPTGSIVSREELDWYFDHVPDHVVTVLDEAYFEFVTEPGYPDSRAFLNRGKPLVGLRTFSKVYGLAGLRVGFAFATPEMSAAMHRAGGLFVMNSLAVEAAIASLSRQDLVRERVQEIAQGREELKHACDELGLTYTPSQANFLFIDVKRDTIDVTKGLLKRGVLVRSGEVHGASTWIRVTVGLPEENQKFIAAFREVIAEIQN
jgi:histidinol-phosphate aminotransferase